MSSAPTELIRKVKQVIGNQINFDPALLEDDDNLSSLGISPHVKQGWAREFTNIANMHGSSGSSVTIAPHECSELNKVRDAIKLVAGKAGYNYG